MSKSIVRLAFDGSVACTRAARSGSTAATSRPCRTRGRRRRSTPPVAQQPLQLRGREVRVEHEAGARPHRGRGGPRRAARRSAPRCAGPATRSPGAAARRCAGPTPRPSRAGSVMPIAATGSSSRARARRASACVDLPDLVGVVLDPARARGSAAGTRGTTSRAGVPSAPTAKARTPVVPASIATITDIGAAGYRRADARVTCTRCESDC